MIASERLSNSIVLLTLFCFAHVNLSVIQHNPNKDYQYKIMKEMKKAKYK